jgi:crotonobetainyl-CoA:carnitine CoA-transferase CaiB-like acyl-CoA transferase
VEDKRPVILSHEQALSMSYATLRMVHQGWRVIRVEPTPIPGRVSHGDPNRSIGQPVAGDDRHSYYVGPNVGKEAIALNLKTESGRALLQRVIRELQVDVFCTNTMPSRHKELGMDDASLRSQREDLIWCCISAMGLANPDVPGYDPVLQALCGYMDLTGAADGPPTQCGPPLIDLKAGDEAFTQVILSLWERDRRGAGRCIDISMAHAAVSWLQTFLPMLDMGSAPDDLRRSGNEHRQFIPVNAYRTSDGYVYAAIGSDAQWGRLVARPLFGSLQQTRFSTNEGRRADKSELHRLIENITKGSTCEKVNAELRVAAVPHAPITPIEEVMALPFLQGFTTKTQTPDGQTIHLPPAAVTTEFLESRKGELPFAPAYGEHTNAVLEEIGISGNEVTKLREDGVVA